MLTQSLTIVALCNLCLFSQESVAENTNRPPPEAGNRIALEADKMLHKFDSTKEPDWLLKAIASVEHQKTKTAEDAISVRVALLRKLASYYDPSYDTNPPPVVQLHVMPPMGYDTGVPPEQVTDPAQRADYVKRLEENRINSQRHKTQTAIRKLMSNVVNLCLNAAQGDREQVETRLQEYKLLPTMTQAMQALVRGKKR